MCTVTNDTHGGSLLTHHKPGQARAPGVPHEDSGAGVEGQGGVAPVEGHSVVFLTVHVQAHL